MDNYRETAFCLGLWYAFLATFVTLLLIALNDVALPTGLLIAANAALLFSLILIARLGALTDQRIMRGQFWRTLPPNKRAAGGLRMARQALHDVWLRFAKGAAALAIVLSAFAFLSNITSSGAWATAAHDTSDAKTQSGQSVLLSYGVTRTLPTN